MKNDIKFEYVTWKNVWLCFIFIVHVQFRHKTEKFRFWTSLKYFNYFLIKKNMSDLNMSHEKMPDFVSFPLFGLTLVIKLRNFDCESHWNILIFFRLKKIWRQIWICSINKFPIFDFVSLLLFMLNLVIKLRKFDLESHWNTLVYFYQK